MSFKVLFPHASRAISFLRQHSLRTSAPIIQRNICFWKTHVRHLRKSGQLLFPEEIILFSEKRLLIRSSSRMVSSASSTDEAESVLGFWFGEHAADQLQGQDFEQLATQIGGKFKFWFGSSKETDSEVRSLFLHLIRKARDGHLDWESSPRGSLAFVILLDQFTRNIFRDSPEAFVSDALALAASKRAIAQGFDKQFPVHLRAFFYVPFEHSEELEDQNLALKYFEKMIEDAPQPLKQFAQSFYNFSERHKVVIERFGRFPHRNSVLGRESTPEEVEYLKAGVPF